VTSPPRRLLLEEPEAGDVSVQVLGSPAEEEDYVSDRLPVRRHSGLFSGLGPPLRVPVQATASVGRLRNLVATTSGAVTAAGLFPTATVDQIVQALLDPSCDPTFTPFSRHPGPPPAAADGGVRKPPVASSSSHPTSEQSSTAPVP